MSYIQIDGPEDTSEMIISLWFRVPKASINACNAARKSPPDAIPPFNGIIPLIVFGVNGSSQPTKRDTQHANLYNGTSYSATYDESQPAVTSEELSSTGHGSLPPFDMYNTVKVVTNANFTGFVPVPLPTSPTQYYYGPIVADGASITTDPSFIGLSCGSDGTASLVFNLETNKKPTVGGGLNWVATGFAPGTNDSSASNTSCTYVWLLHYQYFDILVEQTTLSTDCSTTTAGDDTHINPHASYTDYSNQFNSTETFAGGLNATTATIKADHWHHILLSFKLQTVAAHAVGRPNSINGIDSYSLIWAALDDVNYTKDDLGVNWLGDLDQDSSKSSADPNAVITTLAANVANTPPDPGGGTDSNGVNLPPASNPTYVLSSPTIPGGAKLGMPATAKYVDNIYSVEMGNMLGFTDLSMDTGDEEKRRLFITDKHKPASASKSEKFFGKKAEIKFTSVGAWKAARNQGSLNPDGNKGDAVGEIDSYRPSPNLDGDQGDQSE